MPMVGRSNHHGISVLPGKQLTKIIVSVTPAIGTLARFLGVRVFDDFFRMFAPILIHVAYREHLDFRVTQKTAQQMFALFAHADETQSEAVGGFILRAQNSRGQKQWRAETSNGS